MKKKKTKGFTLIELMIVVAIIAVLASIALPQYLRFTSKAKRLEGVMFLEGLLTAEISYYSTEDTYPSEAPGNAIPTGLGYEPTNPLKFYDGLQYFVMPSAGNGEGFFIMLTGQLDSDTPPDRLCMMYPKDFLVGPDACRAPPFGEVKIQKNDLILR